MRGILLGLCKDGRPATHISYCQTHTEMQAADTKVTHWRCRRKKFIWGEPNHLTYTKNKINSHKTIHQTGRVWPLSKKDKGTNPLPILKNTFAGNSSRLCNHTDIYIYYFKHLFPWKITILERKIPPGTYHSKRKKKKSHLHKKMIISFLKFWSTSEEGGEWAKSGKGCSRKTPPLVKHGNDARCLHFSEGLPRKEGN